MGLTKKDELEAKQVYLDFMQCYMTYDVSGYDSLLDDDFYFVGSAVAEEFLTKKESTDFFKATGESINGKIELRNRIITTQIIGSEILVGETDDGYVLYEGEWIFYGRFRVSCLLKNKDNSWKLFHLHISNPDTKAEEGETIGTEQIAAENLQLRDAIKRRTVELENKSRELEIEASLERVRAQAMGMTKPDNMLEVCETISLQLKSLGVKEIRNVQTAIFYQQNGTYMNYEYYEKHKKTFVTETTYTNNSTHKAFAIKMLKGKGEFFITHIKGKKVKEWINYQKTTNVFIDKYLNEANSLNYYWFSLGPVALGISTYQPLTEKEIKLFKRFVNVFELAYRRYLDIETAIAQAREAQIELALERVRAKTMAMQASNELKKVVANIFDGMKSLGVDPTVCNIALIDKKTRDTEVWTAHHTDSGLLTYKLFIPHFEHPFRENLLNSFLNEIPFSTHQLSGDSKKTYAEYLLEHVDYSNVPDEIIKSNENLAITQNGIVLSAAYMKYGLLIISRSSAISNDESDILQRFAKVFEQTYTRFLDLQKAEAQAREAQIELALERVRARTMAMQKSEELKEVIQVVYDQFVQLTIHIEHTGFILDYKARDDMHIWLADRHEIPTEVTIPFFDCAHWNSFNEAKATGKDFFANHLSFEEKNKFYQDLFEFIPGLPEDIKEYYFSRRGLAISTVLLENVGLYIENFDGIPYTEDENNTLMRFGKVFQQTYTRFLDLQKAETQAREAQIEAALERVRSKAMSMHSTEDLALTIDHFFHELKSLNIKPIRCGVGIKDGDSRTVDVTVTSATKNGEDIKLTGKLTLGGHPILDKVYEALQLQAEYFPVLHGEEISEYYQAMNPDIEFPNFSEDDVQYGYYFHYEEGGVFAWTEKELLEEEINIFRKFKSVLSLTYRRYIDLKEAEAQAREAKIESALERVRSRSLAMHHSSELSSVVDTLLREFTNLEFTLTFCIINLIDEQDRSNTVWAANPETGKDPESYYMKFEDYPFHHAMWDAWKEQKKHFIYTIEGEEKKIYDEYLFTKTEFRRFPKHVQEGNKALKRYVAGFTFFKYSGLQTVSENQISEDELKILERFGRVFEQSYTRFLDLKKAEAQARESQIEVALEKVRSRTMGMQRSDELQDAAVLLFQQVVALGVPAFGSGFNIWDDDRKSATAWMAGKDRMQPPFKTSSSEDIFLRIFEAAQRGESLFVEEQSGEALKAHYKYMFSIPVFKEIADKMATVGQSFPTCQIMHCAFFSSGYLMFISFEPVLDAYDIFKRFAKVFEQTYTRFLDLQKAEEQNKIIQAENERKSKELEDARQLQLSMLPKALPQLPYLDIAVHMKTATEVGGDYYDYNVDADGTLTFVVGDATGHGMMSGMMVSIMKSFFISTKSNIELKQFFENANNSIKDMQLGRLMMACMGVQITSEKIIATNAGMPSLIYFRNKSQKAGEFVSHNFPLGGMKGTIYSLKEMKYERGDTLLLMSDGFAELKNENNEQYGYPRIIEEFKSVVQKTSNEILEHLKNSAAEWANGVEPDDDLTFVVVKIK